MHGIVGRYGRIDASVRDRPPSKLLLLLLVLMNGAAPIALYIFVPALPILAQDFASDISVAQMTVSLYMVGLACSQLIMGPLSDRFGRRPVLLAGLALMVVASIGCIFAHTLPQLIAARFFQALGGASGMVISRAVIRDLYSRDRVGGMLSLVIAVMMIAQMLSPLFGGLIETALGWRAIFYVVTAGAVIVAAAIALALPETRRRDGPAVPGSFRRDVGALFRSRAFIGYALCQVLASAIIFTFAGGGPYVVVTQMGRTSAEYGAWFASSGFAYLLGNVFCVRFSPRYSLDKLIWFGLAMQIGGALLNLVWGVLGWNQVPSWLFVTHMIIMFGNASVMANATAGAISIRPQAAGTASGMLGFTQFGIGSLCSQFGAWLGGHFATPLPLNIAVVGLALAGAASMIFLVPRSNFVPTEELIERAEGEEPPMM
ncbi:MAG: multidrug effflux MFS transporter [Rhodopseudomonas palustris]|uniref:Bcr/CflA family efflux transporter n=1 Tax=Rhodopseudomonas palustris TaxID=1076 RepID=A0A933RVT5_RHOPL|nr:multidrug effflux MFS transporter [Rhodopseudomonas palustris]